MDKKITLCVAIVVAILLLGKTCKAAVFYSPVEIYSVVEFISSQNGESSNDTDLQREIKRKKLDNEIIKMSASFLGDKVIGWDFYVEDVKAEKVLSNSGRNKYNSLIDTSIKSYKQLGLSQNEVKQLLEPMLPFVTLGAGYMMDEKDFVDTGKYLLQGKVTINIQGDSLYGINLNIVVVIDDVDQALAFNRRDKIKVDGIITYAKVDYGFSKNINLVLKPTSISVMEIAPKTLMVTRVDEDDKLKSITDESTAILPGSIPMSAIGPHACKEKNSRNNPTMNYIHKNGIYRCNCTLVSGAFCYLIGTKSETQDSIWVKQIIVRDYRNMPKREAEQLVTDLGMNVELERVYNSEIMVDHVVDQMPKPGEMSYVGNILKLFVSRGLRPNLVSMPKIIGLNIEEALRILDKYDISVDKIASIPTNEYEANCVVSQSFLAGTTIDTNEMTGLIIHVAEPIIANQKNSDDTSENNYKQHGIEAQSQ